MSSVSDQVVESLLAVTDFDVGTLTDGDSLVNSGGSLAGLTKADDPHDNAQHSTSYSAQGHDHTGETIIPDRVETRQFVEPVEVASDASGTQSLPLTISNWFEISATGDVTITIEQESNIPPGNSFTVYLEDGDGTGPHTITWPSSVEWPSGNAVTEVPGSGDIMFGLTSPDGGTTWRANERGRNWA